MVQKRPALEPRAHEVNFWIDDHVQSSVLQLVLMGTLVSGEFRCLGWRGIKTTA